MNADKNGAKLAFRNAYQALKLGDRAAARRWAFQATVLWPDFEDPRLLLAAIASPRASTAYLERALLIHPDSPRVIAGMNWAQKRIQARLEPVLPVNSRATVSQGNSLPPPPRPRPNRRLPPVKRPRRQPQLTSYSGATRFRKLPPGLASASRVWPM